MRAAGAEPCPPVAPEGFWTYPNPEVKFRWHSGPDSYVLSLPWARRALRHHLPCPCGVPMLWQRSPGTAGAAGWALSTGTPTCSSFLISWAFSPREIHHTWFPIGISQTPPAFLSAHHNFCPKPPQQLSGSRRGTFQVLIPSPPSYREERSSCECMEPLCCLRDWGQEAKIKSSLLFSPSFFFSSQSVSLAIVLIKQSPFIRGSLTHFISLLFCFEISRATINFREREREREFNKDLLLLSASIAVMKIYFLSLLCPI